MPISRSERIFDVLVVGAGPAGLAAASRAAGLGAETALVDAGVVPGGQYWRHPTEDLAGAVAHLYHDLRTYHRLMKAVHRIDEAGGYFPQHHVWTISRGDGAFVVHAVTATEGAERSVEVHGRRLVLAPGAYDRQIPFPGWDLPGVMTAGGVQALLKGHNVNAGCRILVAGTGPFLLPVAAGLAEAGATVLGVHETNSPLAWAKHTRTLVQNFRKVGEGVGYARALARHRVPVRIRSTVLEANGDEELRSVTVARLDPNGGVVPRSEKTVEVDVLAVGWGFTPNLELPLALGCATKVDVDGSLVCTVDDEQRSSADGVFIAGEACGIGGADLAVVEGEIAGTTAAGSAIENRRLLRRRASLRRFGTAMHTAHPVRDNWIDRLTDDTLVCRCEEVTIGRLREAMETLGADDARSAKLLARPGMGWCQGRICGYPTACIMSRWTESARGWTLADRPMATPITLGALATGSTRNNEEC